MWDDSASAWASATLGANLSFSGTTLNAAASSGYSTIQEEGVLVSAANSIINFVGSGITAADAGGGVTSITLDATLNALSALDSSTGYLVMTGGDSFAKRELTGTANRISITNGDGTAGDPVINIDLAYIGQTTITTLGTITTGTWQGTAVDELFGGTGITTYAQGDTLYASAADTLAKLTIGANGSVLQSNGTTPSWQVLESADLSDNANIAHLNENEIISGNWEFDNNIVVPTVPTDGTHAASKDYVDALSFGTVKHYADLYADSNLTLSGEQTIDGTLTSTSRVLLNAQSAPEENGVYLTGAGAWSRVTDLDDESEINAALVVIKFGTTYASTFWTTVEDIVTIDTDPIDFIQINNPVTLTAGDGLTKIGDTIDVVTASSSRIVVNANDIDLASGVVGGSGPGSYGSASTIPAITVDTYGRITSTASNAVAITSSNVSDFTEAVQDVVGNPSFLIDTGAVVITYDDGLNTLTIHADNLYTDDGTIPNSTTRTVSLGDATSTLLFQNAATGMLLQIEDDSVSLMDGIAGFTSTDIFFTTPSSLLTMDNSEFRLRLDGGLGIIQDARVTTLGLQYAADYSADWNDRSIVDKEYVDNAIAGVTVTPTYTWGYIESSTATTIDLDANVGEVKDRNGNNIAFTIPSDPDLLEVYRNGMLLSRTGTSTTRDYSLNTVTNEITFVVALTSTDSILLKKINLT